MGLVPGDTAGVLLLRHSLRRRGHAHPLRVERGDGFNLHGGGRHSGRPELGGMVGRAHRAAAARSRRCPSHSEQLKPLLLTTIQAKKAYTYLPEEEAKITAKRRFNDAMERRSQTKRENQDDRCHS